MSFVLSQHLRAFARTAFLLLCFFFTTHINRSPSPSFNFLTTNNTATTTTTATNLRTPMGDSFMIKLEKLARGNQHSKCLYSNYCIPQGFVNYPYIFYCICGGYPLLGYTFLTLWLLVLFYLLANTASQYFCPSVARLSKELRLSPTISGVTLLSLGNGSPDVFASIASFRSGSGEVGLSSVLGGAFFVSCAVVGIINVCACTTSRSLDRDAFVRDACFFLVVLSSLVAILVVGKINVLGAVAFTSLYLVYVLMVSVVHFHRASRGYDKLVAPILDQKDEDETSSISKEAPQGNKDDECNAKKFKARASFCIRRLFRLIDVPLNLPRRLTIPDVSEERWSKPFAVASATLSPLLVAALWNSKKGTKMGPASSTREEALLPTSMIHASLPGILLGAVALKTTNKEWPPRKGLLLFPWLAMGFLMSVLWTYIVAEEVVGLLVSLGCVLGVSPSTLGLTALAWGNSMGDLIANVAMAVGGGQGGAQIAISGCYAGPIFSTLAGLGSSLVVSAWGAHPRPFVIPVGPHLFEVLGFMVGGLVWALVILPKREMKLDRVLGIGLLAIYSCFLSLRLSQSLGLVKL